MRASLLLFILTAAKYTFTGVYAGPSKPMSSTVMCEAPEPKNNAKTPDKLEPRFRMQCIDGYVRQAGTSNLYRCEKKDNLYLWVNEPSLNCIPDPSKPGSTAVMCEAPEPKNNTKTPGKLESQFRMQCIDGYVRQAGTSNLYRCEKKDNLYLWVNEPSLNCIPDPSKPGSTAVMCEAPEPKNNTKTPGKLESQFRMQCIDGYVRQAGTSNLYRCEKKDNLYLWVNEPSLNCIPDPSKPGSTAADPSKPGSTAADPSTLVSSAVTNTQAHTPAPNLTLSTSSTTVRSYCTTKGKTPSTSTTSGQTALTTTHTVPTTTGTVLHGTTMKEETSTNEITLSSFSTLTVRENQTTVSPRFTHSSINTTTTEANERNKAEFSVLTKNGIAAGTVLTLTVIAASAVGVFLWCRRSRQGAVSIPPEEMILQAPGSDKPLLDTPTTTSSCLSDSVQNPDSPPPLTV
ncbi:interleukin-15 receptor subunit alpha isoform X15 [Colossoma macropomum]|uniref:interleukin-15 receptor subunit alpha isoform X14 n=1 Tax=Colossoma macropomum TaxID=42526 RepID=UPI001863B54C|nr:interleukin-15 receptor subunit alpha isoform X14 [Colossoma macropomum]XP_036433181.1 interleukin-15 receptor subunit alpha isoform X15 [Colossoma macropomum]